MVRETSEKIVVVREKIRVAQSRHKIYADQCRKYLEISVGDHVLLKVSTAIYSRHFTVWTKEREASTAIYWTI